MRIDEALSQVEGIDSDTAKLDLELLLSEVINQDRTYLYTWPEKALSDEQVTHFQALLAERRKGRPIAHILGRRAFWNFELEVNNATLIPRPDTELLVEVALSILDETPKSVVDLGTGTGAIAIAIASERSSWTVFASDLAPDAVALARRNVERIGVLNLSIRQGSWFEPYQETFDLIISNPPYIDSIDEHLAQGDLRFEPRSALVAESSGLADLEYLIETAPTFLNPGGWLMLEHGYDQAELLLQRFRKYGYTDIRQECDLGGNMRVTAGQWIGESDAV